MYAMCASEISSCRLLLLLRDAEAERRKRRVTDVNMVRISASFFQWIVLVG